MLTPMSRLLCVLACLLPLSAHALDPDARISQYVHRAWRMRDGIFNGSANAITQTADGYLWIGTENGLIRFDGVRFVPWTPPAGQSLDARIFSVLGTKDGALWIGTGRGIARMKDGRVIEIDHSSRINSIVADRDGVWIARSRARDDKGPICFVTERTFQCRGAKDGITVPTALQVARARDGAFWLAGSKGLRRWIDGRETNF